VEGFPFNTTKHNHVLENHFFFFVFKITMILWSYRNIVTTIFLFSEALFAQRLQADGAEIKIMRYGFYAPYVFLRKAQVKNPENKKMKNL
jgi:hypothetical protein